MGVMAGELGIDFNLAKRVGLLHDIGKAVSHEVEGGHAKIGADLARKYGEHEAVFSINNGKIINGKLPNTAKKLVKKWYELQKDKIMEAWEHIQNDEVFEKVPPLE